MLYAIGERRLKKVGYDISSELNSLYNNKECKYLVRDLFEELFQLFKLIFPLRRLKKHGVMTLIKQGVELR